LIHNKSQVNAVLGFVSLFPRGYQSTIWAAACSALIDVVSRGRAPGLCLRGATLRVTSRASRSRKILQKGGQCSSDSFFFQLFIPTFRAGSGLAVRLARIGKHDRAHVRPRDEPGGLRKDRCCPKEPGAHPARRYREAANEFSRSDGVAHALGLEEDILPLEANRELDRDRGELPFVGLRRFHPARRRAPRAGTGHRCRGGESERPGDPLRDRPFPEADGRRSR